MNSIAIFCICLAIFPALINADFIETLNQWAESGQAINGVFYPALDGFLGSGTFSYSWKGTINGIDVATKFTSDVYKKQAANEYKMYWYLDAVNNNNIDIEAYGIPKVYYFGKWGSYYMLAITLLEPYFNQKSRAGELNVVDILIAIREFVRVSKYIHSRGVYHEDIKRDNIMFRGSQGFIIDFNKGSTVYVNSRSVHYLSQEEIQDGIREAKGDWIRFLPTMCCLIGLKFDFINYENNDSNELMDVEHLRDNIHDVLSTLQGISDEGLRNVYLEFAKHSFDEDIADLERDAASYYAVDNSRPFYDQLYDLINSEIDKYSPHNQTVVSWLKRKTARNAARGIMQSLPDISFIHVPFYEDERTYPKPNYGYFTGQSSH